MSARDNGPTDQPLRDRKSRDRALILPLVGLILLMPPLAGVFQLDAKIAGVPVTLLYLFSVWAVLIAGAAALSWRLRDVSERSGEGQEPSGYQDGAD